jgi:hypothetical protein
MFRWYKDSRVCYAFLEDMKAKDQPSDNTGVEATKHMVVYEEDLARARWFNRGWTLQELIAPIQVDFYDAGWNLFGTKQDLYEQF